MVMQAFTHTHDTVYTIGELCVGGDWACAHGDISALRDVALRLGAYVPEPLHCSLIELADVCYGDPDRAGELWTRLKERLYQSTGATSGCTPA